jgi:hypothetical protein
MDHDPGKTIPVKDGQIVTSQDPQVAATTKSTVES